MRTRRMRPRLLLGQNGWRAFASKAAATRPTLGAAEVLISSVPDVNYARAIPQRHVHKAVQGDYTRLDKIGADRAQKIAWLARVLRGAGCSVVPNFTPA